MAKPIPPHILAELDEAQATLRDLVEMVRQHRVTGCDYPDACPGINVLIWQETHPQERKAILNVALSALAKHADEESLRRDRGMTS